ncbi:MAG: site-2 protease family protein [Cyanophyceae cyanobacterium]
MIVWLLLVGLFAYFIVRQSVQGLTRTPVWLLWLVMMTPAFIWTAWGLIHGADQPVPPYLAVPPFVLCPLLYIFLVQRGRGPNPSDRAQNSPPTDEGATAGDRGDTVSPDPASPLEALALAAASRLPKTRLLDRSDEQNLQDCFPWSVFYLRSIEHRPQAAICYGQLRANPEKAYETVLDNIRQRFSDRFLLVFQEGKNGKPFFALVPNPTVIAAAESPTPAAQTPPDPEPTTAEELALALATQPSPVRSTPQRTGAWALTLLMATFLTLTLAGIALVNPDAAGASGRIDPQTLREGTAYAIAMLAVVGIHEIAHYFAARRHRIQMALPLFIPLPAFLGTLGAYAQQQSPAPNRRALFDAAIAGPLAGLVVSLPLLVWGLSLSRTIPLEAGTASLLNVNALDPHYSAAIALAAKLALGDALDLGRALDLHPIAIAGYVGVWLAALHLLPIGQLDGGRIVHAMLGQRTGAIVGQVARLAVLVLAFARNEFLPLALLLFFMPSVDRPALNDVSPLDNGRDFLGLMSLVILLAIILPAPRLLLQALG